jgi:hypothetical protein
MQWRKEEKKTTEYTEKGTEHTEISSFSVSFRLLSVCSVVFFSS